MLLSSYNFMVKYKLGISHTYADALFYVNQLAIPEQLCAPSLLDLKLDQTEVENLDPTVNILELSATVQVDDIVPNTNAPIRPQ